MEFLAVILLAAAAFGLCYLADQGFTRLFRGKAQHKTGLSVRVNKRYGAFGVILFALGMAAILAGVSGELVLLIGGIVVLLVGIVLTVYYLTFGIFYDDDSFILTTFGRRSVTYYYRDIQAQQLYSASGNIVIELHMRGGRVISLQAGMIGVYPFLDHAFAGWCRQKGIAPEDCSFHDTQNSCWFPPVEEA